MDFFRKLFCRHEYEKIAFREECEAGIRYSVRQYRCAKCKKAIWVDGRFDYIGNASRSAVRR